MPVDRRGGAPPVSTRPGFVLAVDFGGSKTMVAAVDPHGQVLATERLPVEDASGSERILEGAVHAGRRLVGATTCGPCAGVGVATAGIPTAEGILLSPNLPGWDRVRLAERIGDALGIGPVLVGNDVKCAALAEHRWGALRKADPALYLNLGSGVSAAIVVGGRVLHGAHGGAGEIGYAAGRIPETGHEPSTLEDMVGGRRMAERAAVLSDHARHDERATRRR
jgi:glucokinase